MKNYYYNNNCIYKLPKNYEYLVDILCKIKSCRIEIRQRAGITLPPDNYIEVWDSIKEKSFYKLDTYYDYELTTNY